MNTNTEGVSAMSAELGQALDAARAALQEFCQQDDYLLAHGASLMSEDSHEILHSDTLRKIVAAAVAAERERCAKVASEFLTKGRSPLGRAVYDEIMGKGDK